MPNPNLTHAQARAQRVGVALAFPLHRLASVELLGPGDPRLGDTSRPSFELFAIPDPGDQPGDCCADYLDAPEHAPGDFDYAAFVSGDDTFGLVLSAPNDGGYLLTFTRA